MHVSGLRQKPELQVQHMAWKICRRFYSVIRRQVPGLRKMVSIMLSLQKRVQPIWLGSKMLLLFLRN